MPVYQDKDKKWYVKCYYTDSTGNKKQKMKRGFDKKKEAQAWEREFLLKEVGSPEMTMSTFCDIYIDDIKPRIRISTLKDRKCLIKKHILPFLGNYKIKDIDPKTIMKWQSYILDKELSDNTYKKIDLALRGIFNHAVKYYDLSINPYSKSNKIGRDVISLEFWTYDQYRNFRRFIKKEEKRVGFDLLFFSGMRIGELLGLTPRDFDFENNTITINKQRCYRFKDMKYMLIPPKTKNSIRTITMPPAIMEEVKEIINKRYGIGQDDIIFFHGSNIFRDEIKNNHEKAGVPYIKIHGLRHSHVSMLIDEGFSMHLIADRIGDTVAIVNRVYGHLYPSKRKEVADRLNNMVSDLNS